MATFSAIVLALAPGYEAVTWIVGGVIAGYCDTGSVAMATPPRIIIRIAMTFERTGLSMKYRENISSGY